jgi:tetratricopeptide (TPR) repeat protein
MIKRSLILCLLCVNFILISRGGHPATKPAVLLDAENYTNEGMQAFAESNWQRAQRLFTRALSLYQGIDDQRGVLQSHINLAEVALSVRDYQASQRHLDQATDIIRTKSLSPYQQRIALLYALQALQQKHIVQAEHILLSLLPVFHNSTPVTIPDTIQMSAIANRTKIAFMNNQDEALWILRYAKALEIYDIKDYDLEPRLLRFQSSLLQSQGDYDASEAKLQQALFIYKNNFSCTDIAVTLFELGLLYMHQAQWQNAQDYFNRSIAVYDYLRDIDKVTQVTESLEKVKLELGNEAH